MPRFQITWVGDKTYERDGVTEYSIAVKTEDGQEIRKGLKLARASSSSAPQVDEVISGEKVPHPKFDDASLIQEGAAGAGGGEDTAAPAASDSREESIARAVAFKAAIELVAHSPAPSLKEDGTVAPGVVDRVQTLTSALLPIVTGESAEGNAQPPLDTAESVQADAEIKTSDGESVPF